METIETNKHLVRIKEIRVEIKQKEKEIQKEIREIMEILKPRLGFLPKINALNLHSYYGYNTGPLKESLLQIVSYFLGAENPNDTRGFMELGSKKDQNEAWIDIDKIIEKLNPILFEIGLVSQKNTNFNSHNGAINIKLIK